jgi:hypothetical protein
MRTMVTIDDQLLELAKQRARQTRVTVGQVVEHALQRFLISESSDSASGPIAVIEGRGGLRDGIDPRSNTSLLDAMDDTPR